MRTPTEEVVAAVEAEAEAEAEAGPSHGRHGLHESESCEPWRLVLHEDWRV